MPYVRARSAPQPLAKMPEPRTTPSGLTPLTRIPYCAELGGEQPDLVRLVGLRRAVGDVVRAGEEGVLADDVDEVAAHRLLDHDRGPPRARRGTSRGPSRRAGGPSRATVVSSSGLEIDRPALLTTRSTPPNARTAARKAAATCASSVTSATTLIARVRAAELARRRASALAASMSATTTQAPSAASRWAMALPMPGARAGHERDPGGQRLRLGQPAELGLLERPVLDPELLRLGDRRIRRERLGAAHHVDRVDVELAGDAGRLLVRPEREHADPGHEHDRRVRAAHRRAVGRRRGARSRRRYVRRGTRRAARAAARRPSSSSAVGGRSRTIGRTLVRRKWSGHEVPSAASRGCSARPTKSSTTSLSV